MIEETLEAIEAGCRRLEYGTISMIRERKSITLYDSHKVMGI